jgi:acetyl-CoA acyltransferase
VNVRVIVTDETGIEPVECEFVWAWVPARKSTPVLKPPGTQRNEHEQQLQDAYIVAATRTPIGRSHKGYFRNTRPDDLLAIALRAALAQVPGLDPAASIEDVICGCAIPEGAQGLNVARIGAVLAGLPKSVGGITVNRFCASGLSAVQMAADRIRVGEADVMIAAGTESMSMVPMMGNSPSPVAQVFSNPEDIESYGIAYGMGLTAEKVAQQWKVSREAQDEFAYQSHMKAMAAMKAGEFADEITPVEVPSVRSTSNPPR